MEYILHGANGEVVCILLLQPDGTICFKHMSPQVNFKQSSSSNFKKTIPTQLAALGITLDSQLQLLSVKDGVGIYGVGNIAGEIVYLMNKYSNGTFEFDTDVDHIWQQQNSRSSQSTTSTKWIQSFQDHRQVHSQVKSTRPSLPPIKHSTNCYIWYDSFQYLLTSYPHLLNTIQTGQMSLDKDNHIINAITGQEFIPMLGHGGMMAQI